MSTSSQHEQLKEQFILSRGKWTPQMENMLRSDPDYFAAYLKLRAVPLTNQALPAKTQELVLLAVVAQCTALFKPGIEAHTASAMEAGASKEEIREVLHLSSVLGIHAMSVGVPLLVEVLAEDSRTAGHTGELDQRRQQLKDDFQSKRGYWSQNWDNIVRIDPDFFEAYTEYSSLPFRKDKSVLDAKTKELIYCAIDCATTHLYAPGLKLHIRNAVRYGATPEEVMEVFELAALMGHHTVLVGGEVLEAQLNSS